MTAASADASREPKRRRLNLRPIVMGLGPRLLGLAFWIVAPLLCVYAIYIGVRQLTNNLDNTVPGIPGTFVTASHNCQQQLCISSGTFTSDDKRLVEPDLIGDYRWNVGMTSRAVYNATSGEVTGVPDTWDPTPTVVGLTGGSIFILLWGYLLVTLLRRQRAAAPAVGDPVASS